MLIRCPTCASGYDLAPDLLHDGRILRCAHCRDAWVHLSESGTGSDTGSSTGAGPEIVAEASASRPSSPSPVERRPARASRARLLPALHASAGAAPALLAAALLAGGVAAVACKARVVAAFPPSEAVFATLGLPVNLSGLALGEVRSTVVEAEGAPTLTLDGRITNLGPGPTPVPRLRIAVRDKDRRELYHWTAPAPKAQLAAGETVPFHSRLAGPPRDGLDLTVGFAEAPPERRRVAEAMAGDR